MEVLGLLGFIFALIANNKVNETRRELMRLKKEGRLGGSGADPELYDDVDRLKVELTDLQERLDFTERMLIAKKNEAENQN